MSASPIRRPLTLLVAITVVVAYLVALIKRIDPTSAADLVRVVPATVSIDLLLTAWFVKYGWALRVFRGWLVNMPDLRGTWIGHIQSTWKDASGNGIGPIPTMLVIRQTLLSVSCVATTNEMKSYSANESIIYDQKHGITWLNYSYSSNPSPLFRWRSPQHDGVAKLEVGGRDSLDGEYWTQRNTAGEMHLKRINRKCLQEFPRDLWDHPMKSREGS